MKYDVVIAGSGLGGLQCAFILSQEGYNVCLIEKNNQLGGCLQTFKRDNCIFDTGMHYIGSVEEGQLLNSFFKYFNLEGRLHLRKLDEEAYEIIRFGDREYRYAMGYDRFSETMAGYFPNEKDAIRKYTEKLREVSSSVDLINMKELPGQRTGYFNYFSEGINDYLDSITHNREFKKVLLGNSPLYAGVKGRTPLYTPMIIHSTYIESAYRFVDGGSQISNLLADGITQNGGTIMKNARITKFLFNSGLLSAVEINGSEKIEGISFISNIHPKTMLSLFENAPLRPAFFKRISGIEDTYSIFSLYLVMKENSFKYVNSHYYIYSTDDVWQGDHYDEKRWPESYMIHFSPTSENNEYANSIIITAYMKWDEVTPWEKTRVGQRGEDYNIFKLEKAEKLLSALERDFPGIRSKIKSFYSSSPLTYRDYTGTCRGSMYGLLKDYNNPLKTLIMPRTKIPNLFLTGQNINVHGVIGVTIGSVLTCGEMIGISNVLNKIRNA
jgi:all-trans-retinol 13,14-reductase